MYFKSLKRNMHKYVTRTLSAELSLSAMEYPVVTVIGPR